MASYKWEAIQEVALFRNRPRYLNTIGWENSLGRIHWTLTPYFHVMMVNVFSHLIQWAQAQEERLT